MLACFEGCSQLQRTKLGRRTQQNDIDIRFEYLFETVEATESMFFINVDLTGNVGLFGQRPKTDIHRFGKRIGNRNELRFWVSGEGLLGGTGSTAAAADQSKPKQVAARRMHVRRSQNRRGRTRCIRLPRRFEKSTP
jgi:hypothetical protein